MRVSTRSTRSPLRLMMKIAGRVDFHMWEGAEKITYGIYACSPTEGSYQAVFSNMQITECQWKSDADWRD